MRILYILRSEFGLIGTNASYMFPSIVNRSHKVRVLSFEANKNEKGLKVFKDNSVDVREFPFQPVPNRTQTILKQIEYFNPDIVHHYYHGQCMFTSMVARSVESRRRKWFLDIRSPLFGQRQNVKRERRRNLYFQQYYDGIFTHDPSSPKTVFPFVYKPVYQAPLAINSEVFKGGIPAPIPSKLLRSVFVGSIARRRKLDFLLHAYKEAQNNNINATLDIYGSGNDLNRLTQLTRELGLENVVTFKGLLPQKELMQRMKLYQYGICYVPQENYSNAPALKFYEYCAAGLFPLCSKNKGILKAKTQGFKAEYFKNTPESFVKTLMSLPNTSNLVTIRQSNHEISKDYTWEAVVERDLIPRYVK